jgi:tetratricopeptide (TPR) repeat protein
MDFFGAYDVDADRGVVAIADHRELPGKKAWTWGEWEFGKVAQQNLTDEDGPYIEVQSGPLPTQSDYGLLWPRQRIAWREWWYPVHGLGDGFEFATRDAAVNTFRVGENLEVRILTTAEFPHVRCHVEFLDGSDAEERVVRLSPKEAQRLRFAGFGVKPVRIRLLTAGGSVLLNYVSPLEIPQVEPPDPSVFVEKPDEEKSAEELYLKGRRFDRDTNRLAARRYYELALQRDPGYTAPLRALAVLDLEGAMYEQALERLERVLLRDPDDGLAWFAVGICQFKLGKWEDAVRTGYHAARFAGYDALGYDLAGRAAMRLGEYSRAIELFRRAARLHPEDTQAQIHLILALRAAGRLEQSRQIAERLSREAPTLLLPQWALTDERTLPTWAQRVQGWCGEYNFNMTEAALTLGELGLFADAASLLQVACWDTLVPEKRDPMAIYLLAYFREKSGQSPEPFLDLAPQCPREFVFASRPEELPVLEWVISRRPEDAYAYFQLGNLLANLGQVDRAAEAWSRAVELDPKLNIAWRNLGLVATKNNQLDQAEQFYRQAIAARPDDQTLYRDLAEILTAAGRRTEAIELLEKMPYQGMRRADVIILLAQYYVEEKRWTDAIQLLESTPYFVNWEGQDITWRLFHRARLERGIEAFERGDYTAALADFEAALTYLPNLGVGRSNRPPEAKAQYWRGRALAALGKTEEARKAWEVGASLPDSTPEQNQFRELCRKMLTEETSPKPPNN